MCVGGEERQSYAAKLQQWDTLHGPQQHGAVVNMTADNLCLPLSLCDRSNFLFAHLSEVERVAVYKCMSHIEVKVGHTVVSHLCNTCHTDQFTSDCHALRCRWVTLWLLVTTSSHITCTGTA